MEPNEHDNGLHCLVCKKVIPGEEDPDPCENILEDVSNDFPAYVEKKCPHGVRLGDCDACDFAGDIAYDAAREMRHR